MAQITPKSPELLKAQVAAFAAEKVEGFNDNKHILNNLDGLISDNPDVVTRVTQSPEYQKDQASNTVRVPENTEMTVTTAKEYKDFLRAAGGSKYEAIQGRADILTQYEEQFKPTVKVLRKELQDMTAPKEHPAFMGSGSNSSVFRITHNNNDYAVRIPNGKRVKPSDIDRHLAGAVLGRGIPHLEQIIAASYEDGITVAEIMPGKEMDKTMTIKDVQAISNEHLAVLVDTLIAVNARGIEIDPKPSNFFYDSESGFGIVDYKSSKVVSKNSADQSLGVIIGWMATPIMNAGFYGRSGGISTSDVKNLTANLDVCKRFRDIVDGKLTGQDRETALEKINKEIESYQETINRYSNPEYIANLP